MPYSYTNPYPDWRINFRRDLPRMERNPGVAFVPLYTLIKCKTHPTFTGKNAPKSLCEKCCRKYNARRDHDRTDG